MAGRPRSRELDERLLRATAEIVAERGYAGTTVDTVAARAAVPKSALYRRWDSKARLVFDAVVHGRAIECPDTGSLDGDLRELSRRIVAALSAPGVGAALPGLLADLADDEPTLTRFRAETLHAERELVREVLRRAVTRGELDAGAPRRAGELHAQLLGTAFAQLVLLGLGPSGLAPRMARAALATVTT